MLLKVTLPGLLTGTSVLVLANSLDIEETGSYEAGKKSPVWN